MYAVLCTFVVLIEKSSFKITFGDSFAKVIYCVGMIGEGNLSCYSQYWSMLWSKSFFGLKFSNQFNFVFI